LKTWQQTIAPLKQTIIPVVSDDLLETKAVEESFHKPEFGFGLK
jgi:hypothetical protein